MTRDPKFWGIFTERVGEQILYHQFASEAKKKETDLSEKKNTACTWQVLSELLTSVRMRT